MNLKLLVLWLLFFIAAVTMNECSAQNYKYLSNYKKVDKIQKLASDVIFITGVVQTVHTFNNDENNYYIGIGLIFSAWILNDNKKIKNIVFKRNGLIFRF